MKQLFRRPTRLVAFLTALLCTAGLASAALVYADDTRVDWDCPGTPRTACTAIPGYGTLNRSFGSSTAVNSANPYPKCSALSSVGGDVARLCGYGYTIRVQSNDRGYCSYPNNAGSSTSCGSLQARVGNDTDVHHGLRGVAYF